jgi:hypothetical protein
MTARVLRQAVAQLGAADLRDLEWLVALAADPHRPPMR